MLLSLLPGLRDLRTPLAVGYLWLFFVWLVWGDAIPPVDRATGLTKRAYELVEIFGATGGISVLTFLAYIFCCVLSLQWLAGPLSSFLNDIFEFMPGIYTTTATEDELNRRIEEKIRRHISANPGKYTEDFDHYRDELYLRTHPVILSISEQIHRRLRQEFPELTMRLQLHDKSSLYESYDRKMSEAEFRLAITLPLAAIIICLAFQVSPWILFVLMLPISLALLGVRRGAEARSEVFQALLANEIKSETLEDLGPWFDDAKMASEMQNWVEKEQETAQRMLEIAARATAARPAAKRGHAPPPGGDGS
jgi:hypothetical protein